MRRIQTVELADHPDQRVHCPFCGDCVLPAGDDAQEEPTACAHTLFVVTRQRALYRSRRFDICLGLEGRSDAAVTLPEGGWPALTETLVLPDAVRFARAEGLPADARIYVGFAPLSLQAGAD